MKRENKTSYEWRKAYIEKKELLEERGFPEVSPYEFYRDLFPVGSLQQEEGDGKGNIIATQVRPSGQGRTKQWVVDDSLELLDKVVGDEFGLIPPISFFGKTHTKRNAHALFALAIDIDYVGKQQLKNLLKQFGNGVQLCPSYLVSSGKGVHLYYFLKEPLPLYQNLEGLLKDLKVALINRLWNDTSSIRPNNRDITGIFQGFRCVGSQSKLGPQYPVRAYRLSGSRYTLEEIKASIPSCKLDLTPLYEKPRPSDRIPLAVAKELYPEWYQARIVEGKPKKKGTWTCNEALYEWWKRKITDEVKVGGRYFSIMALCAYGLKCGIPEKQIKQDAYAFLEHLEQLTDDEDNHFTENDVKDALKALKADRKLLSTMASREWIEENTKVPIPPRKRRKKPLKRDDGTAFQAARMIQNLQDPAGEWRNKNGAPTAQIKVANYRAEHPDASVTEVARELGISRTTVYKWWSGEPAPAKQTAVRPKEQQTEIDGITQEQVEDFAAKLIGSIMSLPPEAREKLLTELSKKG